MNTKSSFYFPPPAIANCVFAAIFRDTRGVKLNDFQRMNYFPASPLYSVSVILHGQLHVSPQNCRIESLRDIPKLSKISVSPPQERPTTSWSPGAVSAISIGFYPEAWLSLGGERSGKNIPEVINQQAGMFTNSDDIESDWNRFCMNLDSVWKNCRSSMNSPQWSGSKKISDWTRHFLNKMTFAGPGHSVRAVDRRIKRWSGQSRQMLNFYSKIDSLHHLQHKSQNMPLAAMAHDAGFADQSHMGRAVKRATGFSPAKLNRMIDSEEAFWCYRLMGERF